MLLELQTAITNRFNSSAGATLRSLVQGIWPGEAPSSLTLGTQKTEELKNSTLPFIIFNFIFTSLTQDFCSNLYEPLIQYTIFGDANNKTPIELLEIGNEVLSLYGGTTSFSMANGYSMIRSDPVGQRYFKDTDLFWNVIYEIQYIIQKDR